MSGPKVVRIVTREEIEAICRRHIAVVTSAVHDAIGRAGRCGKLDDAVRQSLMSRVSSLEALFAQGRWMTIQKQGPETVLFLKGEGDRLEKAATEEAARARTRRRRTMDAARSVAAALAAAGVPVGADLERAAKGRSASLDDADRAISAALAVVPAVGRAKVDTAGQAALAARLGEGETVRSVGDLLAGQQPEVSADNQRLDALLAELQVLGDAATGLAERADVIAGEGDMARRRLLTDSLIMDTAMQVAGVRRRRAIDAGLRQAAASLDGIDTAEANALRGTLDAAVGHADEAAATGLGDDATRVVETHTRNLAAAARRRAVLSGLSSLGYEIREIMGSAWERDGRLVVRKPGTTDYGVELGAPADATRFQVRLVGSTTPGTPRDARRDTDQEVIWCGEFERLRGRAGRQGRRGRPRDGRGKRVGFRSVPFRCPRRFRMPVSRRRRPLSAGAPCSRQRACRRGPPP